MSRLSKRSRQRRRREGGDRRRKPASQVRGQGQPAAPVLGKVGQGRHRSPSAMTVVGESHPCPARSRPMSKSKPKKVRTVDFRRRSNLLGRQGRRPNGHTSSTDRRIPKSSSTR